MSSAPPCQGHPEEMEQWPSSMFSQASDLPGQGQAAEDRGLTFGPTGHSSLSRPPPLPNLILLLLPLHLLIDPSLIPPCHRPTIMPLKQRPSAGICVWSICSCWQCGGTVSARTCVSGIERRVEEWRRRQHQWRKVATMAACPWMDQPDWSRQTLFYIDIAIIFSTKTTILFIWIQGEWCKGLLLAILVADIALPPLFLACRTQCLVAQAAITERSKRFEWQ